MFNFTLINKENHFFQSWSSYLPERHDIMPLINTHLILVQCLTVNFNCNNYLIVRLCPSDTASALLWWGCICVCMFRGGKGGQVFRLTLFNKGCVWLFAFAWMCFCPEYTSRDMDGWKLLGLLEGSFIHYLRLVWVKPAPLRGLLCLSCPYERKEPSLSGTSD